MNQLFNYNGNNVSFRKANDNVYVNATEMAKPFGKFPNEYLRLPSTNQLLNAITGKSLIASNQIVISERGGLNPGTWLHEDIAVDYAQWLSVDFRLWVSDRIKQLLKTGVTTITDDDDVIAQAMQVLQKRLEAKNNQLELANNIILEQAPKVQLANECYSSTVTMTTTILATRLGYKSASSLNKDLKQLGVQYKIDNCWKLYAKHEGKGFTKTIPVPYKKSDGTSGTQNQMEWFEAGFVFLRKLLNQKELA